MQLSPSSTLSNDLVIITWSGINEPLSQIQFDEFADFEILIFDYSGKSSLEKKIQVPCKKLHFYSAATECKGDIFWHSVKLVKLQSPESYVGLIDDDVSLKISSLNRLLAVAKKHQFDVFSPTLTPDSFYSFKFTLTQNNSEFREVSWVEVMMPFYRCAIIAAGEPFFSQSKSSWGIDKFAIPLLQHNLGLTKTAIVDTVTGTHTRPITSRNRIYSNGLTADQEASQVREFCLAWMRRDRPDLFNNVQLMRLLEKDDRLSTKFKKLRAAIRRRFA